MTRKHFEAVARIIRRAEQYEGRALDVRAEIAKDLAAMLGETNPRFDAERFIKACGVQS